MIRSMWDGSTMEVRPSFAITAVPVPPPSVTCVDTTVKSVPRRSSEMASMSRQDSSTVSREPRVASARITPPNTMTAATTRAGIACSMLHLKREYLAGGEAAGQDNSAHVFRPRLKVIGQVDGDPESGVGSPLRVVL